METQPKIGKITVAPEVLETIARLTTLAVPGVARVARVASPLGMRRLLRHDGVKIEIIGNSVCVKLYVVTEPHVSMLSVGRQIQAEVTRAIQDMVGMEVKSIDVHIEDVACPSACSSEEA